MSASELPSMSSEGGIGHGITSHFEFNIDPGNPPPAASPSFTKLREQASNIWKKFEAAENALIRLDDQVDSEVLGYVSLQPHATRQELNIERSRIMQRLSELAIVEAENCCQELEAVIPTLQEAARNEPKTIEGQATLQVDAKVMRDCLVTTREIIEVSKMQLSRARFHLGLPF
jgi:hypothetical protein